MKVYTILEIDSVQISIIPDDDFSDITPHCLRHTFATQGLKAGLFL